MKLFTTKYLNGYSFGIEFANGNMALYTGKVDTDGQPTAFGTSRGATAAGERFQVIKGNNWEHGNLNYKSHSLVDGKLVEKVEFVHLSSTY